MVWVLSFYRNDYIKKPRCVLVNYREARLCRAGAIPLKGKGFRRGKP